jgi:hypothetical protein
LAALISGFDVQTVVAQTWGGITNGKLLTLAQAEFDAFVTVDRNLSFQQNLPKFSIAVLVLVARSNRLADLKVLVPKLIAAIPSAQKGTVTYVA